MTTQNEQVELDARLWERYLELRTFLHKAADIREKLLRLTTPRRYRALSISGARLDPFIANPDDSWEMKEEAAKHERTIEVEDLSNIVEAVTDTYWGEKLAVLAQHELKLSEADIDAIQILHEAYAPMEDARMKRFGPRAWFGALVAAVAFLASQVPKEIFERIGWDYVLYRAALLGAVVLGLAWTVYAWAELRGYYSETRRDNLLCSAVLTVLVARRRLAENLGHEQSCGESS